MAGSAGVGHLVPRFEPGEGGAGERAPGFGRCGRSVSEHEAFGEAPAHRVSEPTILCICARHGAIGGPPTAFSQVHRCKRYEVVQHDVKQHDLLASTYGLRANVFLPG
eukprot:2491462-Pleurochrysis_carterae.AAC.1